MMSSLYLR